MKRMLPICTHMFSQKNGHRCLKTKIQSWLLLESLASISIYFKKLQLPDLRWPMAWCWRHLVLVHVVLVQAILYFTESMAFLLCL